MKNDWFEVSKNGLKKQIAGRDKVFVLFEMYQNGGLDTKATRVDIILEPIEGKRNRCLFTVTDDHPAGFTNLDHSFTLYEESEKKDDPNLAGRFNLGGKLVLALCVSATISSTKGTVHFSSEGRKESRVKRETGSRFDAVIEMTRKECEKAIQDFRALIPRDDLIVTLNGEVIEHREPIGQFETTLPTVRCDDDGVLRNTKRKTMVYIYEPGPDEEPMIYELGIPVVATGDKYHVSIGQKVPLNTDRDNVTPGYLRQVRTLVANETFDQLTEEEAQETWVVEAIKDDRINRDAYEAIQEHRHGKDAVVHDPSRPEATKRAVAAGLPVIYGRSMSPDERANSKRFDTFKTAHEVTPAADPYDESGPDLKVLPKDKITEGMRVIELFALELGREVLDAHVQVTFANDSGWPFAATFGRRGHLTFNVGRLGYKWFDKGATKAVISLIIHEFGHYYASDHLSEKYYHALSDIGAKVALLAIERPEIFQIPE